MQSEKMKANKILLLCLSYCATLKRISGLTFLHGSNKEKKRQKGLREQLTSTVAIKRKSQRSLHVLLLWNSTLTDWSHRRLVPFSQ